MSTAAENKALVRLLFEEIHIKKNHEYGHNYLDEDYVDHTDNMGKTARIAANRDIYKGIGDYQMNIEGMVAEGDKVVYWWSGWIESQNSEKENWTGVDIKRIVNGKIKDQWWWMRKVE